MIAPVEAATEARGPRLRAVLREEERVTALELFFDLVFVLAVTQCTALMAHDPSWGGVGRGLLVLAVLWWCWVGYAWLTSVVDPEEGAVRIAMFASMAALLVAALAVPHAFGSTALVFAIAYGAARAGQIALFLLASRGQAALRDSVLGLAASSFVGISLLVIASQLHGTAQSALWCVAIVIDVAGPYFRGVEGWQLVPGHFAERHGLIVLIAIGESIVAIGSGARAEISTGVVVAAVAGVAVAATMWWLYFDVVAIVATRHLASAKPGREQNSMARDSYSYLHFGMVAGIILLAFGVKTTLAGVGRDLHTVPAAALFGGAATYLLAHVAFRLRNIRTLNKQRLLTAIVLVALIPLVTTIPALAALCALAVLLTALITYEAIRFSEGRNRIRHELAQQPVTAD
jgi:low temperature requirement protein LtrA